MTVTEKEINKVLLKHPWLPREYAIRMVEDRQRKNWRTPEGIKIYNREYGRLRRAEAKGEVADAAGVIAGKYLDKRGSGPRKPKT